MLPLYLLVILGISIIGVTCSNCCLYYYACCDDGFIYQDYESDVEYPFCVTSDCEWFYRLAGFTLNVILSYTLSSKHFLHSLLYTPSSLNIDPYRSSLSHIAQL